MKKILIRFFVTLSLIILILYVITFGILKFKHANQSNLLDIDWDWTRENKVIWNLINEKYPAEGSDYFPIVRMKNIDIPLKQPDEKRILVIGDSFVWGYGGTNTNYTWWKQLDQRIKEAGYSNVNVYAAGKYFFNTNDQLEKILNNEKLMERINPDLIIIGYVYNDPEERDETNLHNIVKDTYEQTPEGNAIYEANPILYQELKDRYNSMEVDYEKLKLMGELLGGYRFDLRALIIAEGENLEKYKKVLKRVDDRVKELGIPYFYYFTENVELELVTQAAKNVYNEMKKMSIDAYYTPFNWGEMVSTLPNEDEYNLFVSPGGDAHPGIVWTYDCAKKVYKILQEKYNFIFENAKIKSIDEIELNINDTMPFIEINKISKNIYELEYPLKETERTELSKFLFYPLNKNYIKLNLEYPKKISKIKVEGENLKNIEIYVNTINEEYNYDLDDARQVLTPCKKQEKNTYNVGYKISSINIVADFINEDNRKIKIEFIE